MKLFRKAADGGENSGVTGFFLIECKSLFSIVLLRFSEGTREAFHSHAFNAVTLWLKGRVIEHEIRRGDLGFYKRRLFKAGNVKRTPRTCFHKIEALEPTWALSLRGPWVDRWCEYRGTMERGKFVTLTHGRREVETTVRH